MERLEKRKRRIEQVNCDAEIMSPVHQCDAMDRGSSCEDVENEKDLYPTIECDNESRLGQQVYRKYSNIPWYKSVTFGLSDLCDGN